MQWFLTSPIALAVAASMLYGIGSPFIRVAGQLGVSPNGLLFMAGAGYLTASLLFAPFAPIRFATSIGFWTAATYGLLFGIGFRFQALAMTLPSGLATIVLGIIAAFPLISMGIELGFMNQAHRVHLPLAIGGTVLIITGAICVSNSIKGSP